MRFLKRDHGAALPDVMVSVLISGVAISLMFSAVIVFSQFLVRSSTAIDAVSDTTVLSSLLRGDALAASMVEPTSTGVTFTTLTDDCDQSRWVLDPGALSLQRGPCGTALVEVLTWELADTARTLTFVNAAGRTLTFDAAGTPTLEAGTKPLWASDAAWESLRPVAVTLEVALMHGGIAGGAVTITAPLNPASTLGGQPIGRWVP